MHYLALRHVIVPLLFYILYLQYGYALFVFCNDTNYSVNINENIPSMNALTSNDRLLSYINDVLI